MRPVMEPAELVRLVKRNLTSLRIEYESIIIDFGQVKESELRAAGKAFSFDDHLKALIMSFLSNQRPWKAIHDNRDRIEKIFYGYDHKKISEQDPAWFVANLKEIACGNRRINSQMKSLRQNIGIMKRIESEYGTLDIFVTRSPANLIAKDLSDPASPNKLRETGLALALEYLKNVGIRAGKPDIHMIRILSADRLGYSAGKPSEAEAFDLLGSLARQAGLNEIYFDNLLWLFCAVNYGNICGSEPKCHICLLRKYCNY